MTVKMIFVHCPVNWVRWTQLTNCSTPQLSNFSSNQNLRAPAAIPETPISPEILEFVPSLCSGSFSDIGMRRDMEYEHICIDDLFLFIKSQCRCCIPSSFMGYLMAIVVLMQHHTSGGMPSDLALADECTVSSSCGSTTLIALVLGRVLLVANVGDCRAVICRGGKVINMSHDHRGSVHAAERLRVEKPGGYIDDWYLNGVQSVT
ncbi:uncharacterized protein A4U43_C04F22530 [Asparagus officinalis]|uniref:protein-serine/threonine phosphatase n=1 Tax=Asparagus officinalis TaxID=4686 RepID=A0A5P1F7N2_ASPOF|nr:uncharacterized protein A4U43_C04F22530 [Asparagus officinalis]